ncbi:MAG: T9SS type A sorting domain-containing protein [Bacteroidota bacterium]
MKKILLFCGLIIISTQLPSQVTGEGDLCVGFAQRTFAVEGVRNGKNFWRDTDDVFDIEWTGTRWEINQIGSGTPLKHSHPADTPNPPCSSLADWTEEDVGCGGTFGFPLLIAGADCSASLSMPVELSSFAAQQSDNLVVLTWQTAAEINNERFVLEHSRNGADFKEIGQVSGAGNSLETNNYQFLDREPITGTNYYRLLQVDFDGSVSISRVVSVVYGRNDKVISLLPNPASSFASLRLETAYETQTQLGIFNNKGRLIYENTFGIGQTELTVEMEDWSPGTYYVRMTNPSTNIVEQLVKLK